MVLNKMKKDSSILITGATVSFSQCFFPIFLIIMNKKKYRIFFGAAEVGKACRMHISIIPEYNIDNDQQIKI